MPERLRITSQMLGNSMPSTVEPVGQTQLDGRARECGRCSSGSSVALDHLDLVAAAEDARQHARGVDQLARHVDRHEADDPRGPARRLSIPGRREIRFEQRRSARCDAITAGWCSSTVLPGGERLARKAADPRWRRGSSSGLCRYRRSTRASSSPQSARRGGARPAWHAPAPRRCAVQGARRNSERRRPGRQPASHGCDPATPARHRCCGRCTAVFRRHCADAPRQQAGRPGANTPRLDLGWPNCASGARRSARRPAAISRPPPRHRPRTGHHDRHAAAGQDFRHQAMRPASPRSGRPGALRRWRRS